MAWNPFKKRIKGVYSPRAKPMKIDFISVIAVAFLSLIGLWALSYLFGNWMGLSPIGPIMMVVLFAAVIVLSLVIVKNRKEGMEMSNKDLYLVLVLVVLLVLGYMFLPDLAPELFRESIMSIQTQGLQAFVP